MTVAITHTIFILYLTYYAFIDVFPHLENTLCLCRNRNQNQEWLRLAEADAGTCPESASAKSTERVEETKETTFENDLVH